MRSHTRPEPTTEELAAYLEGELATADTRRVESILVGSLDARRRLQQLRSIRERLAAFDPDLEQIDLVPALDRAIAAEPAKLPRRVPPWIWGASMVAAACVTWLISPRGSDSEFRAKSAMDSTTARTRAGMEVWRLPAGGAPEPVGEEMSLHDGLLFKITNVGSAPFTHLMLFAIDAGGEIRWFYPAYVENGSDPTSIPIGPEWRHEQLPYVVTHRYVPGPLVIYALFTRESLRVSEVEAWLSTTHSELGDPPGLGAKLKKLQVVVKP